MLQRRHSSQKRCGKNRGAAVAYQLFRKKEVLIALIVQNKS